MPFSGGANDDDVDGQFDDVAEHTDTGSEPACAMDNPSLLSSITLSAAAADHDVAHVEGQFDDVTEDNDGPAEQKPSQQDASGAPFVDLQQLPLQQQKEEQLLDQMQHIHLNSSPDQQHQLQLQHSEMASNEGNSEDKEEDNLHSTGGNITRPRISMTSKDVLTASLEAVQKSMLSVGSGDGSQQEAVVRTGLKNLQVTFYDSKARLLRKYPHAAKTLAFLAKECQHPPRFQVDATQIDELYEPRSFDLVFFTFPHNGIPNNDKKNVKSNQRLLQGFLRAASKLLKPDGEIQITLKNGEHYERWNLPTLLDEDAGLTLQSSHTFEKKMFPGYKHRLTKGMKGSLDVVPDNKGARVYVFESSQTTFTHEEDDGDNHQQQLFAGKLLTIVQSEAAATPNSWTDDDLWTEVFVVLESFSCVPCDVLEVRRQLDPQPETRQLNRVLYDMERSSIIQRQPPLSSKNQKPRWTLIVEE